MGNGGCVTAVQAGSLAEQLGVRPGDMLLAVNGHPVQDVLDVQFYAADEYVELRVRRGASELDLSGPRDYAQALGLEFAHPTFDVDMRRCNNCCPFCFVLQMPPRMRRSLYVKDDDYRYSFLFGHYVTLTNLSAADWKRIEQQHLSPLYISVHATPLKIRRKVLGNPNAPDIIKQLRWLAKRGIEVHTQLVITPGLNDGAVMERSVLDLAQLYPAVRSVSIVPVGITRYHKHGLRLNTPAEMQTVLKSVHAWQKQFKQRLGVRFVYATDEWYLALGRPVPSRASYDGLQLQENGLGLVREFLEKWKVESRKWKVEGRRWKVESDLRHPTSDISLVTGTLFAPTLRQVASEASLLTGISFEVIPIVNRCFGETVTVAGLLTAHDVIEQLQGRELGQQVVLPRVMFDQSGISLDDMTPDDISRAVGRPVALSNTLSEALRAFQINAT